MMVRMILFIVMIIIITSCTECEPADAVCNQTAPANELCAAYFQRWFYDKKKNVCIQIGYSGCSQYGFATKPDCEVCRCD
jgi:hypothetical protein